MTGPEVVLRSAWYEGAVRHVRLGPGPRHEFTAPLAMPFVRLDHLDELHDLHPLCSARHPAPLWLRRRDHLGDPALPLDMAFAQLVAERLGPQPRGPVALLTQPRLWGWCFNPISLAYCYDPTGREVRALVAEVESTPWHERHPYVLGPPGRHVTVKAMHVSPFLPTAGSRYRWRYEAPGERLMLHLEVQSQGEPVLRSTLLLHRQPLTRAALAHHLWRRPVASVRVSAGIYGQAVRLAGRRAPFHPHPSRRHP